MARSKPKDPLDHEPQAVTWARERSGLTKTQLAERAGISLSLMCEIEKGTRNAQPPLLLKLAEAMNCPVVVLERKRATSELIPKHDIPDVVPGRKVA